MSTDTETETMQELFGWLVERQFYPSQKFADDRSQIVALTPMIFTWAIVYGLDRYGMAGRYCYDDVQAALTAYSEWSGNVGTEPAGWIRHPETGRRRINGDPSTEYVAP